MGGGVARRGKTGKQHSLYGEVLVLPGKELIFLSPAEVGSWLISSTVAAESQWVTPQ